jgi:hypothetical protein
MAKNKIKEKPKKKERLKPISLYPLEVEEALENILKVNLKKEKEINNKKKTP